MSRRNRERGSRGRDRREGRGRGRHEDRYEPEPRPHRERERDRGRRRTVEEPATVFIDPPAREPVAMLAAVCGNCREWYPHETGGRGECSHPGSGFLSPWSDTPGCPFFAARR